MPTIIGLFKRYEDADLAIRALEVTGVSRDRLQFAARKNAVQLRLDTTQDDSGIRGVLAGLKAFPIMGLGPIFVTTAVRNAKGSSGLSLLGGGLSEVFCEWGVDREEAQDYAGGVARGGIVVAVHLENGEDARIREIFSESNSVRTCLGKCCTGSFGEHLDEPAWTPSWSDPGLKSSIPTGQLVAHTAV